MTLNSAQMEAAESTAKTTVVIAGPGSGKTRVIIERVRWLLEREGFANTNDVVILTFTNAAAKEIVNRLSVINLKVGYCGTLHGWCMRLLREHGHRIGYRQGRPVTILDDGKNRSDKESKQPSQRDELIEEVKRYLGYGKVTAKAIADGTTPQARAILAELGSRMKANNMVDYDTILKEGARLAQYAKVSDLLVDEAQDSGVDDWAVYDAIQASYKMFVGDLDQSIYGFRFACPKLLLNEAREEGVRTIMLERNYRSDVAICLAANRLIGHNLERLPKLVNPNSSELGAVFVQQSDLSRNEALDIARLLKDQRTDYPFDEMAVVARTNVIADEIRSTLREIGLPVEQSISRQMPSDWSFCLAVIQLILDPANNLICQQVLRGMAYSLPIMNRAIMESRKTGRTLHELTIGQAPQWKLGLDTLHLPAALTMSAVSQQSVETVLSRINTFGDKPTLEELMADLWKPDMWEVSEKQTVSGVSVSTIHAVKGKEFDLVVVAGCEEGVLPSLSKASSLEEERRMMFVATTRARKLLVISHCAKRFAYGKTTDQQPSRFIEELQS